MPRHTANRFIGSLLTVLTVRKTFLVLSYFLNTVFKTFSKSIYLSSNVFGISSQLQRQLVPYESSESDTSDSDHYFHSLHTYLFGPASLYLVLSFIFNFNCFLHSRLNHSPSLLIQLSSIYSEPCSLFRISL